jgi:Excalibur calcium-binding domain
VHQPNACGPDLVTPTVRVGSRFSSLRSPGGGSVCRPWSAAAPAPDSGSEHECAGEYAADGKPPDRQVESATRRSSDDRRAELGDELRLYLGLCVAGTDSRAESAASARGTDERHTVTTFKRSNRLYTIAMKYNKGLDRDKDGIACESG